MQKRWDVVVVGGANMDYLIRGPELPDPGETLDGDEFLIACGGKGANQAVAARRLGAKVAFVGRVGRDNQGDDILKNFSRERVDARCVRRDPGHATGAALVMVDAKGEKEILVAPGANHSVSIAEVRQAKSLLQHTRVLLLQFEISMRVVVEAARIAYRAGAKIVLDPAPAARAPRD